MARPSKVVEVETSEPPALEAAAQNVVECREILGRLRAEKERCARAASAGDEHIDALESLRAERRDALAEAFADGASEADTTDLDKAISEYEHRNAKSLAEAETAHSAGVVLAARIRAAENRLEAARDAWRAEARRHLLQLLDEAENRYGAALEALAAPVAQIEAIATTWKEVSGPRRPLPADGRSQLREVMRGIPSLRVKWTFSSLRDPAVRARYASPDVYQGGARFVPEWLDVGNASFATSEIVQLREQLHIVDCG
jgi:hypothetical protein